MGSRRPRRFACHGWGPLLAERWCWRSRSPRAPACSASTASTRWTTTRRSTAPWGRAPRAEAACTRNGNQAYPYGATYDGGACNGADYGDAGALGAGAVASCVGGFPGLHDMSGNVREFEDACDESDAGPLAGRCHARGGASNDTSGALRCDSDNTFTIYARDRFASNVGIRCCAG